MNVQPDASTLTSTAPKAATAPRWSREEVDVLFALPFNDLMFQAQQVHRQNFDANEVQISTLLSIKTGGCAENCGYCNQSAHHETGLAASKLMEVERVLEEARKAKDAGATRYCMGAAWREPKDRDLPMLVSMIEGVREMEMETCMTLGMLSDSQVVALKEAGLDYYNHNIDTSESYYDKVVTTRTFQDRLNTLARVKEAGINVCSGGIVGMGEAASDRADMLLTLANLPEAPGSVPINLLVRVKGTPLSESSEIDPIDFIKTIAVARILMPTSMVRLSAGRESMSDEMQALCFMGGANSIFLGDKLLTTNNASTSHDEALFAKLGLRSMPIEFNN
jgi:biotin synthase